MMGADVVLSFAVQILIEPDDDGFHAFCPALKGLHVGGRTEEEAIQNAEDAAIIYLKSLIRHGDAIPLGVIMDVTPVAGRVDSGIRARTENLALSLT